MWRCGIGALTSGVEGGGGGEERGGRSENETCVRSKERRRMGLWRARRVVSCYVVCMSGCRVYYKGGAASSVDAPGVDSLGVLGV